MKDFPKQIEWLAQHGLLSKSAEEIEAAKAEYRKLYKRASKKLQRSLKKEYRPRFTEDEVKALKATASTHGKSVSTFIHHACLAYINQVFLLPNPTQVTAMEKSLARTYLDIRSIKERLEKGSGNPRIELLNLMRRIEEYEIELRAFLRNPPLLTTLVRDALTTNPEFRLELQKLFNQ
jgi:uncharacterized protein (DUF1778 family)